MKWKEPMRKCSPERLERWCSWIQLNLNPHFQLWKPIDSFLGGDFESALSLITKTGLRTNYILMWVGKKLSRPWFLQLLLCMPQLGMIWVCQQA
jgi:hypothetical protein